MEKENREKYDAFAVLRVKDFRLFVTFRFFMTIAIQMQSIIVGWQVYQLTKDPLSLGLAGLSEAIPFILVALFAGHVADRFNRKKVILWFYLLFLLGTVSLLLFTLNSDVLFPVLGILPIYGVVAITGVARSFLYPSTIAVMAQIVPRSLYTNSSTWNSTVWHIAAITGPAIGGLVYGFYGVITAYLFIISFVLISLLLLLRMKVSHTPSKPLMAEELKQRMMSGIRFVFSNQILLGAMALDMFAVLFGGAVAMLPVFAAEVLLTGPEGLGFLRAAPMVGAVIMSFVLTYRPPMENAGKALLIGVAGFGLSIILFALSKNFYLSMFLLMLSGMFDNISVVIRSATMQLVTPDEMRGRVASVNSIFIGSSNEIGSFESGVAARLLGLVPSVIFGGIMTLLVVGVTAKKAPLLRRMNLRRIMAGVEK